AERENHSREGENENKTDETTAQCCFRHYPPDGSVTRLISNNIKIPLKAIFRDQGPGQPKSFLFYHRPAAKCTSQNDSCQKEIFQPSELTALEFPGFKPR